MITSNVEFKSIYPKSVFSSGGNYWVNGIGDYFYVDQEMKKTVKFLALDALDNPKLFYNIFNKAFLKSKNLRIFSEKYTG